MLNCIKASLLERDPAHNFLQKSFQVYQRYLLIEKHGQPILSLLKSVFELLLVLIQNQLNQSIQIIQLYLKYLYQSIMSTLALLLVLPFTCLTLKLDSLTHECFFDSDCNMMRNCDWSVDPNDKSLSALGNFFPKCQSSFCECLDCRQNYKDCDSFFFFASDDEQQKQNQREGRYGGYNNNGYGSNDGYGGYRNNGYNNNYRGNNGYNNKGYGGYGRSYRNNRYGGSNDYGQGGNRQGGYGGNRQRGYGDNRQGGYGNNGYRRNQGYR